MMASPAPAAASLVSEQERRSHEFRFIAEASKQCEEDALLAIRQDRLDHDRAFISEAECRLLEAKAQISELLSIETLLGEAFDGECEQVKTETISIVQGIEVEAAQMKEDLEKVNLELAEATATRLAREAVGNASIEEVEATLRAATDRLTVAEEALKKEESSLEDVRRDSGVLLGDGRLSDIKVKEVALEMGHKNHEIETKLKDIYHTIAVTEKKAKAEELEASLKEEALERKWSLVEASAEHSASMLGTVRGQIDEMRERALKAEAEARVTAEEISEVQREAGQVCLDFQSRTREVEETCRGLVSRVRDVGREKAVAMEACRHMEEAIARLEQRNKDQNQELVALKLNSASLLQANSVVAVTLALTKAQVSTVGNRSLDFVARVRASRHSQ